LWRQQRNRPALLRFPAAPKASAVRFAELGRYAPRIRIRRQQPTDRRIDAQKLPP